MRFVLDVNVFVSGLLSPSCAPGRLLDRWLAGAFELIVSEQLLEELERALGYSKIRERIPEQDSADFLALIRGVADLAPDPDDPPPARSNDPDDDDLIALAAQERAHLVSGDSDLLASTIPPATNQLNDRLSQAADTKHKKLSKASRRSRYGSERRRQLVSPRRYRSSA